MEAGLGWGQEDGAGIDIIGQSVSLQEIRRKKL